MSAELDPKSGSGELGAGFTPNPNNPAPQAPLVPPVSPAEPSGKRSRIPAWAKRKRFWLTSLIVIILAFILATPRDSGQLGEVKGDETRTVETLTIAPQDAIETTLTLKGAVQPREFTGLKSLVTANLDFLAPIGSAVRRGQVIARMSDSDTERAYLSALGSVSDASSSLGETQALNEEALTQAGLNVGSAEVTLNTTQRLNNESLRQAEDAAEVAYASGYNTIEQVLSFWGGGTKTDFILKATPNANKGLLNPTESEFFSLLETFESLPAQPGSDLDFNIQAIEQAVEEARTFNDRVFRVLSFSVPLLTGDFTQATIDGYKAQAIVFQAQVNRDDQAIKTAKSNLRATRVSTKASLTQAEISLANSRSAQESAKRQAEIRELSSSSQVNTASLQLASAQDKFSELTLTWPFNGVVISHRANVGDQVSIGRDLMEIGQIEAVEIELLIDQASAKLIDLSSEVLINNAVPGLITELSPSASLSTGKLSFTVSADNSDGQLTGGDVVEVDVKLRIEKSGIIVVPLSSVTVSQTETFLLIAKEREKENDAPNDAKEYVVEKRNVVLGDVLDSQVEIVEGLAQGDFVILTSGELLSIGEEVQVNE